MKKIALFLLLTMTILLVGCSSSGGLNDFTKEYNENARKYNAPILVEKEFGEIEDDENMSWQTLFESQKYDINAKYKDGKNVSGHRIVIKDIENFAGKDGTAYDATLTIVDTLGLDPKKLDEEIQKMLNKDNKGYVDNGYKISLFLNNVTDTIIYINIDKK